MGAFLLNNVAKNVLAYKCHAENYLRESDIDYIIIRPLRLVGNKRKYNASAITVGQGDTLTGTISRASVGKVVYAALMDKNIPSRVTFECINTPGMENERFTWENIELKPDSKKLLPNEHFEVKKNYWMTIISTFLFSFFFV